MPGEYIPEFDDDKPLLNPYEAWLFGHFRVLHFQRPMALEGVAALPFGDLLAYWRALELSAVCPAAEFFNFMTLMDRVARAFYAEAAKPNKQSKPTE